MSETPIMNVPLANEFTPDAFGLTAWRATLDGITVRKVFGGVQLEMYRGDQRLALTLEEDHARHLASLLTAAVPP